MPVQHFGRIIEFIKDLYPGENPVPLHAPRFRGLEKEYLAECIDSTFVSYVGAYVTRFEEAMREFTGAAHAVAMVNGTAALHLALVTCGVGHGDDVITAPLTFVGTCNGIAHSGAQPCFVDIDRDSLGLSPTALADFLRHNAMHGKDGYCYSLLTGRRIAACLPVHVFGHLARMPEIMEICAQWNIQVIEDAAESLGSYLGGQHSGVFGRMAILSFNGNKVVTTGGGGMIITSDAELAARARHLSTTAKKAHAWEFNHDMVGYNYRMPNVNAAIGCAQMECLPAALDDKRTTAALYHDFFAELGIPALVERDGTRCNYWLNGFFAENRESRDAFLALAKEHNVQARPVWTLMTRLPMYNRCPSGPCPNSEWAEARIINVPSSVRLG